MKVLMIDSLVGCEYTECLCSGLSNTGVDICLIVPKNKKIRIPINFPIKKWAPTKDQSLGKIDKTIKYIKHLVHLLNYIQKENINVVHYQFFRFRSESLFFAFLKLLRINLVYTAHNLLPHEITKIDYLLQFMIYKSAKAVVVHSMSIKNKLVDSFPIRSEKIHIIPHGNYDTYLPEKSISKNQARKKMNLSVNDDILLFFGNIREYKGLDLLLDAFQIASECNKQLKLIIAGASQKMQLETKYKERIAQLSSKDRVIFHSGFIPSENVAFYFIASDIIILPYKNIYHSGVVHLAYSFGRPIIATKVGDLEEAVEHGKSGFLVDCNNPKSLAKMINTAFINKKKLDNMGRYARKLSEKKYSWNNIALQTLEMYKRAEK